MLNATPQEMLVAVVRPNRGPAARIRRRLRPTRSERLLQAVGRSGVGSHPALAAGAAAGAVAALVLLRRITRAAWLDEPLTTAESEVAHDAAEPSHVAGEALTKRRPIMHMPPSEPVDSPGLAIRLTAPGSPVSPTAPATGGPLPASAPDAPNGSSTQASSNGNAHSEAA